MEDSVWSFVRGLGVRNMIPAPAYFMLVSNSAVGSGGVHRRTSSFDITASESKGAKPAPLKPPQIWLSVIDALKAAL
jgi:hypothetical protein